MTIQEIAKANYEATKKRGLITDQTTVKDFTNKLNEELYELICSIKRSPTNGTTFDEVELGDIALVCFAMAEHFKIDLVEVMELKTKFNQKRKD